MIVKENKTMYIENKILEMYKCSTVKVLIIIILAIRKVIFYSNNKIWNTLDQFMSNFFIYKEF